MENDHRFLLPVARGELETFDGEGAGRVQWWGSAETILETTMSELNQKLREVLGSSEPWQRTRTTVGGVFIVKLPKAGKRSEGLALEVNPIDESGAPTKRKGFFVRSLAELKAMRTLLSDPKVEETLKAIEAVCPVPARALAGSDDVVEI
jgi:hypothetical protein